MPWGPFEGYLLRWKMSWSLLGRECNTIQRSLVKLKTLINPEIYIEVSLYITECALSNVLRFKRVNYMFSRRLFLMLELVSIGGAEPGSENVFSAPFQRIGLKEAILHTYVLYSGLPVLQMSQGSDRRVAGVGAIQWRALNLLFNFGSSPFAKIVINFLIIWIVNNHHHPGNST